VCDISWNHIDTPSDNPTLKTFFSQIATNTTLKHLDISHNMITSKHFTEFIESIKQNHTLVGLHVLGNEITIDMDGNLWPHMLGNKDTLLQAQ